MKTANYLFRFPNLRGYLFLRNKFYNKKGNNRTIIGSLYVLPRIFDTNSSFCNFTDGSQSDWMTTRNLPRM